MTTTIEGVELPAPSDIIPGDDAPDEILKQFVASNETSLEDFEAAALFENLLQNRCGLLVVVVLLMTISD